MLASNIGLSNVCFKYLTKLLVIKCWLQILTKLLVSSAKAGGSIPDGQRCEPRVVRVDEALEAAIKYCHFQYCHFKCWPIKYWLIKCWLQILPKLLVSSARAGGSIPARQRCEPHVVRVDEALEAAIKYWHSKCWLQILAYQMFASNI